MSSRGGLSKPFNVITPQELLVKYRMYSEEIGNTVSSAGNEEMSKANLPGASEGKCANPEVTNPGTYINPGGRHFSYGSDVPRCTQSHSQIVKYQRSEKAEGGGGGAGVVGGQGGETRREKITPLNFKSDEIAIPGICDTDEERKDITDISNRVFDVSLSGMRSEATDEKHVGTAKEHEVSKKISDLTSDSVEEKCKLEMEPRSSDSEQCSRKVTDGDKERTDSKEWGQEKREEASTGAETFPEAVLPVAEMEVVEDLPEVNEEVLSEENETFLEKDELFTRKSVKLPVGKPFEVPDYLNPKVLADKLYVIPGLKRYSPGIVEMCLLKTTRRKEKYYKRLAKREEIKGGCPLTQEAIKTKEDPSAREEVAETKDNPLQVAYTKDNPLETEEMVPTVREETSATEVETPIIQQTIPNFESASKQFISRQMDEFEKRFMLPVVQRLNSENSKK